ncbi:MAG: hypothetical protein GY794_23455, partial [bacterium]|nr:hypothetical protein [bacterium]
LDWEIISPEKTAGKWPITLNAGDQSATVYAVFGEGYAPESKEDIVTQTDKGTKTDRQVQRWVSDDDNALIKEVRISYSNQNRVKGEGTFGSSRRWLKWLDWFEPDANTGAIKALFSPWLVLYIGVYIVVMFGLKAILRVA